MNNKLTVTVGISAFNEEGNIKPLLTQLLDQKVNHFILKKIIVVSDCSTDNTVGEVKSIADKKIELIEGRSRLGKPKRLNQLFGIVREDVLIILDADIKLKDTLVIFHLIEPFLKDKETSLVLGRQLPLEPTTFIEKLAYFGFYLWEDAKASLGDRGLVYNCTGQIRAFSRKLISHFRLPDNIGSAEDAYSFYFAMQNNLKVIYADNAIIYFRLANTFKDYTKQMSRFLIIPKTLEEYFSPSLVQKYQTITPVIKYKTLLRRILQTSPIIFISYLFLQLIPKVTSKFDREQSVWAITSSSKKLN